jgi:hypothetical protein
MKNGRDIVIKSIGKAVNEDNWESVLTHEDYERMTDDELMDLSLIMDPELELFDIVIGHLEQRHGEEMASRIYENRFGYGLEGYQGFRCRR